MTRITDAGARPYRSQLRAEQAEETRSRILDATIRVMARGIVSVSIPEVAREAGVSVPTVYRHFGTKRDLLMAVHPYLGRRAGIGDVVVPETVEEFHEMVRSVFGRLESLGEEVRIAMSSAASDEVRKAQTPGRYAMSRTFTAGVMPGAGKVEQERLARVLVVLASSSAMRIWRDHLGSAVEVAADDIDWVLRTVIASTPGRKNS
jgi:AcrR family transcriptional regulator